MQLLRRKTAILLDLSLRLPDLQHVHGRKPLGIYLQRGQLAVPGLRRPQTLLNDSYGSRYHEDKPPQTEKPRSPGSSLST